MPGWEPKIQTLEDQIAEAKARREMMDDLRMVQIRSWTPNIPTPVPTLSVPVAPVQTPQTDWATQLSDTQTPMDYLTVTPTIEPTQTWQPQTDWTSTIPAPQPAPTSTVQTAPPPQPKPVEKPVSVEEPLWLKTMHFVGKPFELVQEYLFNPLLAGIHQPFTRTLTGQELQTATQEGIRSYFPGGVRYQAYEDLQYPGKWAVEMLPWLIVPPFGTVGVAGAAGRGIAGALSKVGKAGQLAGRMLEYSPAGIAEKVTGAVIGKVTGKVAQAVTPKPVMPGDSLTLQIANLIQNAEKKLPEKAQALKELHGRQLGSATAVLESGATGAKGLKEYGAAFGGKGEVISFESIATKLGQQQKDQAADMILNYARKGIGERFVARQAETGWNKTLKGIEPVDSELGAMEKIFGPEIVNALLEKKGRNVINLISDVANAPRAVLSAVDLSGLLRQGAILTARHPVQSAKSVIPMVKSFFSDKNAQIVDDIIQARPHTALAQDAGLYLAPLPGKISSLSSMEESFMSKWIQNMPVIGSAVKASNRSYVTGLNDLRSRSFESTVSSWEKLGVQATDVDYKSLATLINAASGRGTLWKSLQGASPLMNAMLFSPRLFISRLQFPTMLASDSPLVRKEAAKQLVSFLGAGTAILGMAKVAGAGIELDPRSADFAKLKIGNTRLDIWSGYAQWARFMAQLTTEQRKTQYGNFSELNRRDVVDRFFQSKFSPAAGLINDLLKGESYSGEEVNFGDVNVARQAWTRFAPLFIQDMIDAIDQEGLIGGVVASPGLFGVGVTTYMSPANKMREQLSQQKYGMSWQQVGTDPKLGLAAQMDLERSSPALLGQVQVEKDQYNQTITGKTDLRNIYRNQGDTIETEYQRRVQLAAAEYRDTMDGNQFRLKLNELANNRRSQYDVLNRDPQFAKIVAQYNELPSASDLQKMSPQDWARKEYMRLMYSPDMYDQYGNYRFDVVDDVKALFVKTFGQGMLDYVESYQGIKEANMPKEYLAFKEAQRGLRPYWEIATKVEELFGKSFAESPAGKSFISKQRKIMRMSTPNIDKYIRTFYAEPTAMDKLMRGI